MTPPLRPVEPLPVVPLDPALVRERLAELDREREVQQGLVDTLANVLDMAQQTLAAIDQRIADTRTHPAVQAALREDQT